MPVIAFPALGSWRKSLSTKCKKADGFPGLGEQRLCAALPESHRGKCSGGCLNAAAACRCAQSGLRRQG